MEDIKVEVIKSDFISSSRSLSQVTVASLAAEVVSQLKFKSEENVAEKEVIRNQKGSNPRSNTAVSEEVLKYYESKRNAKKEMSEEDFARLSKPFQNGWRRECLLLDSYGISGVCYVTPPHPEKPARRLRSSGQVGKYLQEVGETNLVLENFSMRHTFLGFGSENESVRKSTRNSFQSESCSKPGWKSVSESNIRTGWKYDNFFEVVTKNDEIRFKCLLCGKSFTQKGNFGRHVKIHHEPDETCDKCGKDFRPTRIQDHRARCGKKIKDVNDNQQVKTTVKRSSAHKSHERPTKVFKREVDDDIVLNNSNNTNNTKPVAGTGSPHCLVKTSSNKPDLNLQEDDTDMKYEQKQTKPKDSHIVIPVEVDAMNS